MKLNRMTGLMVLEVINSNPNGDPDLDSDPRLRDNDIGEISPVSIKRKFRDLIEYKDNNYIWEEVGKGLNSDEFRILESRMNERKSVEKQLNKDFEGFKNTFWDARLFGNTFLEKNGEDTIRSGAMHFGVGLSVAPVKIKRETFTKKAPAQIGKSRGMAPLGFRIVEYGIYTAPFFFSPHQGQRTGCRDEDVTLFLNLFPYIYDHTRSLVRSQVNIIHAHVGWHGNKLGTFKEYDFIKALQPMLKSGVSGGSREDYTIPSWDSVQANFGNVVKYQDVAQ